MIAAQPLGSVRPTRYVFGRAPMLVYWEMTRACPLACRHCRAEAVLERSPRELTTAEGERLLDQIGRFGREYPRARLGASIGIAHLAEVPASADEAVRRADGALYAAKGAGKGRIAIATSHTPPRVLPAGSTPLTHRPPEEGHEVHESCRSPVAAR